MLKKLLHSKKNLLHTPRDYHLKEEIILRDFLSLERTRLANERTFLSYIRTSLYLIVGGFALLQIESLEHFEWAGYLLFAFSAVSLVVGTHKYLYLRKTLVKYYDD